MTEYVCVTCNMNCVFTEEEYEEYHWVLCPYFKEFTDLVEEDE